MNHRHKPGCRCALCLGEREGREGAAQQLYGLLQMNWVGMQTAKTYAELARDGIEEAFPNQACVISNGIPAVECRANGQPSSLRVRADPAP